VYTLKLDTTAAEVFGMMHLGVPEEQGYEQEI
jgi:hypothetical protein